MKWEKMRRLINKKKSAYHPKPIPHVAAVAWGWSLSRDSSQIRWWKIMQDSVNSEPVLSYAAPTRADETVENGRLWVFKKQRQHYGKGKTPALKRSQNRVLSALERRSLLPAQSHCGGSIVAATHAACNPAQLYMIYRSPSTSENFQFKKIQMYKITYINT